MNAELAIVLLISIEFRLADEDSLAHLLHTSYIKNVIVRGMKVRTSKARGRRSVQLEMVRVVNGHGGKRRGAGRKRAGVRRRVEHGRRESFAVAHPVHVTLRVVEGVRGLRRGKVMRALRRVLWAFHEANGDVSVVEFAVLHDHLHLIVEAADSNALARGMQGLLVRLARAINGVLERKGRVFADRYHAHVLRTPREVRHALAYVLHNARKHAGQRARRTRGWLDPCSTAAWFVGFRDAADADPRSVALALALGPPGTRSANTWLLREGWRRCGLVSVDEAPRSS